MLDFFKSVVDAGAHGLAHSDILVLLVNTVLGGKEGTIHKQGRANIAKCVASLVSHNVREAVGVVKLFMGNFTRSQQENSEEVMSAASYVLGNIALSNLAEYL